MAIEQPNSEAGHDLPLSWRIPAGIVISRLTKRRLFVVVSMGLALTLIEMLEHYEPGLPALFRPDFWHRLPIYAIALPLITWLLLGLLDRSEQARSQAQGEMERLTALNRLLVSPVQWHDVLQAIVQLPGAVAPVNAATLCLYDEVEAAFEPVATWPSNGSAAGSGSANPPSCDCVRCPTVAAQLNNGIGPCRLPDDGAPLHYCASLKIGDRLMGLLQFHLPEGAVLSDRQQHALERALPEMALALANARIQHSFAGRVSISAGERRRIAQDLHDTLAQNIGYLRLKLDQFATAGPPPGVDKAQQEINYMRDVANEAYRQIRETLAALDVEDQGNLAALLRDRAELVGERAGLDVRVVCLGEPRALNAEVRHQVLFITREALNNVEKHAAAESVLIQLNWEKEALTVEIEDDGVGFDPQAISSLDHLGLSIMVQRAKAIRGNLTMSSAPGSGTRILLWLPIP